MHRVSVILPVYNGEKYIREAVQSVLSQTWCDFTLHVIDDGSTDNTIAILYEFEDERLQIIKNDSNQKLIFTLNKGLQLSIAGDYQYIIRMDADDVCLPQRFEKQVAFMDSNPDIGLCGSWVEEFNESGTIKISERSAAHEEIVSELFFQNTIWHPSVIIRTEIIKAYRLRFESEFIHAEDYALWNNISQVTKLANLQEVLLRYRVHDTNVSFLYKEQQRQTCVAISEMNVHRLLYDEKNKTGDDEKKSLQTMYVQLLNFIPTDANKVTQKHIKALQRLIDINQTTKTYNEEFFKKSLSAFMLQYWSLWCKQYSIKTFRTLFIDGAFFSTKWPLKRRLITIGKCFAGWTARKKKGKASL